MALIRGAARAGADALLRSGVVERTALARAGRAGRGLVFLWHRVAPDGPGDHEVVRTVALATFEAQLDLLMGLGEVVAVAEMERSASHARPRFALTFDDDDPGHAAWAMPALRARGLPATFFLSGRWLRGDGLYWWEELERRIRTLGARAVATGLGLPGDWSPPRIAAAIAGTDQAEALAEAARGRAAAMVSSHAAALTGAGMEIGFHTRDHPVLPLLDDDGLRRALTDGRQELADALGMRLDRFAYPHGRADGRVAAATLEAGFSGAWTTAKTVARHDDPAMLRGRWDLGSLPPARFRARILRALVRPRP